MGTFGLRRSWRLRTANISDVPAIVGRISSYRRWADSRLKALVQSGDHTSREELNASLALLPVDRSQLPFLEQKLIDAPASELPVLRDAMGPHRSELTPKLWTVLEAAKPGDVGMLPGGGRPGQVRSRQAPTGRTAAEKVAPALVAVNPIDLGSWLDALRPVQGRLVVPLVAIFRDKARPETEHVLATNILAEYGRDDPDLLAELIMIADPKAYKTFFAVAERQREKVLPLFQAELARKAPASGNDASRLAFGQRRAGPTAGPGGGGHGPHGQGRGGLAAPSAQRRPAGAQFHYQLAECARCDPEVSPRNSIG